MTSPVFVANLALSHIGVDRIESLSEASAAAVECNRFYAFARDYVLQERPWRVCKRTRTLELAVNDRADDWAYRYLRPTDALKVFWLLPQRGGFDPSVRIPFEAEGQSIYTGQQFARVVFAVSEADATLWGPLLTDAIAWQLAHRIALPLFQDRQRAEWALQGYERAKALAASSDIHETSMGEDQTLQMAGFQQARY